MGGAACTYWNIDRADETAAVWFTQNCDMPEFGDFTWVAFVKMLYKYGQLEDGRRLLKKSTVVAMEKNRLNASPRLPRPPPHPRLFLGLRLQSFGSGSRGRGLQPSFQGLRSASLGVRGRTSSTRGG